jgi:hypothetical protein
MDLNRRQEAAAFHGLATNKALPLLDRLQCALQALDLYEAELEVLDGVVFVQSRLITKATQHES